MCKSCSGRHFYSSCQATQTENLGPVTHIICCNGHTQMKIPQNILKDQQLHFSFIDVSLLYNGYQHVSDHLQGGENKNKNTITIHSFINSAVNLTKNFMIFKLWSDLGKAVPLQAWTGPEGSRKLRFPDFVTMAQNSGRLSALRTDRLYPQQILLVLISVRG